MFQKWSIDKENYEIFTCFKFKNIEQYIVLEDDILYSDEDEADFVKKTNSRHLKSLKYS